MLAGTSFYIEIAKRPDSAIASRDFIANGGKGASVRTGAAARCLEYFRAARADKGISACARVCPGTSSASRANRVRLACTDVGRGE
jgi:hypothetical protein